jgi:hypothetical protein
MNHYNSRCYTTIHKLLTATLLLLLSAALSADELKPFNASYMIYRNEQHVADASFTLQKTNDLWIWRMQTTPRGIYKWLTRKRPFIETQMRQGNDSAPQLLIEVGGDYPEMAPQRAIWFDQDHQMVYYSDKKKQRQLPFKTPLYNYHSINLLYQQMKRDGDSELEIDFFKGGDLKKSRVTLETGLELRDGDSIFKVDKLAQTFEDSKDSIQYFYQNGAIPPLKIVQFKSDNVSVMWRSDEK